MRAFTTLRSATLRPSLGRCCKLEALVASHGLSRTLLLSVRKLGAELLSAVLMALSPLVCLALQTLVLPLRRLFFAAFLLYGQRFGVSLRSVGLSEERIKVFARVKLGRILLELRLDGVNALQGRQLGLLLLGTGRAFLRSSRLLNFACFLHEFFEHFILQDGLVKKLEVLKVLHRVLLADRVDCGGEETGRVPSQLQTCVARAVRSRQFFV